MTPRLMFLAFLLMVASGEQAYSQSCTITGVSNGNYGTVDILSGAAVDSTASFTVNCTSCGAGCKINTCVQINGGTPAPGPSTRKMLISGSNYSLHEFYSDSGRTQVFGSWAFGGPNNTVPYGSGGVSYDFTTLPGSQQFTIYGRFMGGQQTVTPNNPHYWSGNIIVAYSSYMSASPNCTSYTNAAQNALTWQANVPPACNISAASMNFGAASQLSSAIDTTATLSLRCTFNTNFTVGLDYGLNATGTQRRMRLGSTSNYVNYNLYTDYAYSKIWKTSTAPDSCSSGAGSCVTAAGNGNVQTVTVYGRVPAQTTPPSGVYTDTVVITMTF